MSHSPAGGATPREMGVIDRMTVAEGRVDSPTARAASGEGLELIREPIAEPGRRREFEDQADEARVDDWPPGRTPGANQG